MPPLKSRARRAVNFLKRPFNWHANLTIEGRRYIAPVYGGERVRYTEPWMTKLLAGLLERPGGFIDVGANTGQTMLKVCALDPVREYVGFEPNPHCVSYLLRLVRLNHLENCTIYPAAISTLAGIMPLTLYDGDTDSSASLVPGFRRRTGMPLNVAVLPESAVPLPDQVAALKIDVEGGELDVIRGLLSTIRRTRPAIVVEILPAKDAGRMERQKELEAILSGEGYRIGLVNKETAAIEPVDTIGENRTMAEVDFVFSPT